jgi:hypothetical protein
MEVFTMKRARMMWVACAALVIASWSAGSLLAGRDDDRHTRDYSQRIEQIAFRARIVSDDMKQHIAASQGAMREEEQEIAELTVALNEAVSQLDAMMKASQKLLENDVTVEDPEIVNDVKGVRSQLDDAARTMENALQYIEHMAYKIHKLTL